MGGQCYYFDTTERTRDEAKSYCSSNHGKLWEPKTIKKINDIHTKAASVSNKKYWWIGMTDSESEGTFKFDSNGEKFPFLDKNTPWIKSDPNGGSGENCALMYSSLSTMHFLDSVCTTNDNKHYSICESTSNPPGNVTIFNVEFNCSTEGSCLMLLLGPGKSRISLKLHYQNFYFVNAVTK